MEILAIMFIALTSGFLLGELFNKLNMPKVLGPIILGLIFAQKPFFYLINSGNTLDIFNFVKDIAIIFLMFFVGLKIDFRDFKKTSKKSLYVGFLASIIPFILGFSTILLIDYFGFFSFLFEKLNVLLVAFVFGICMSVTAEGVIIGILEELNLIKSLTGEVIIESGIIDDVIAVFFISVLVAFIPNSGVDSNIGHIVISKILDILVFAIVIFVIGYILVPRIMKIIERQKSTITFFTVSIMITLFLAMLSQFLDLGGSILGALFGGMMIRYALLTGDKYEQKEERDITKIIEVTTFGFFAPFFFIWIGLSVNLQILFDKPFFIILFILLGIFGKLLGSVFGNKFAGGKLWQGYIIAWGMNTKGGVDIMIATLALTSGIININLFSILVFMSFASTLISPIMFKILVKKHHGL